MKTTTHILIILIWTVFCFSAGYIWYDYTNNALGNVRGGARTGFHLKDNESIGISTTTTIYDIAVDNDDHNATLYLGSDEIGTSTHCIILMDSDELNYCSATDAVFSCSTTTPCN